MRCCCSGASDNTQAALFFANAAKRVTMQPRVNEIVRDKALLRHLQMEIASLRKQLVILPSHACHILVTENTHMCAICSSDQASGVRTTDCPTNGVMSRHVDADGTGGATVMLLTNRLRLGPAWSNRRTAQQGLPVMLADGADEGSC